MSTPAPAVSVVMPVWRPHPQYFREALSSVLRQTLADIEVIIIEDPSDWSAAEAIREAADPRIRYLANPSRTSIVEQHNRGVGLARAGLIARFDSDDVCEPDRMMKQKAFLDTHPEIGVVGCQLRVIDDRGREIGIRRYPTEPAAIRVAFRRFNPIANPAVMFRRRIAEEHGGWTPGSNGVARDYAWFSHLAAAGVPFANLDEPLVHYRLHRGALKQRKLRETAATTYEVKREHWLGEMTSIERAIMLGERLVSFLPQGVVLKLFRRMRIEAPPGES